jgi:hypothetical protein
MKQDTKNNSNCLMNMNVILTFDTGDKHGDTQEICDLRIPVSKNEIDAMSFLNEKFFKRVVSKCNQFNRSVGDLIKISTCSNWDVFESTTNLKALSEFGHDCKWYFGTGRNDLGTWERVLMSKYGFGMDADMSRLNDDVIATMIMKARVDTLLEKIKQNESKISSADSASI